jgi:hypothetical protein
MLIDRYDLLKWPSQNVYLQSNLSPLPLCDPSKYGNMMESHLQLYLFSYLFVDLTGELQDCPLHIFIFIFFVEGKLNFH